MIELKNVCFSYGTEPVFKDFSLTIPDFGVTVILGPSGCGKTTLLRLICGLEAPQSGSVSAPEPVSVVFQQSRLLPWLTAEENVAAVLPRGGDAGKYLAEAELAGFEDKLPEKLSGGQQRRAALARALAFKAPLLALDEPFTGLDFALALRLLERVKKEERLVLLVTHDETLVKLCDNIVRL